MKVRFLIVLLVVVLSLSLAGCAASNAESSTSNTDLDAIKNGDVVRLSYNLNESIKIELVETGQTVTVSRAIWRPFAKDQIFWVRANGKVVNLADAIRASSPEPIQGTVRIYEKDGKMILEVYKDASLIP
ncbi:hypothetical protein GYA27_02840 [candidate division WWE3 bacterium]|uniref:DUF3221 domain-containing protein n=1 Tax=candidate division WWE3 bacterium TaxID=2053526 RepID=A0A7X9DKU1_UNCKA|nr:hypothetical protein [candidate division WWE3 bacterium]